ncbi:hypothetical protein EDB83DRAFT_2429545 [Lactarius deliciosus]|nr:hypothetical protein EDB83DRAFT_2429545 [Lactarius deliciosus]
MDAARLPRATLYIVMFSTNTTVSSLSHSLSLFIAKLASPAVPAVLKKKSSHSSASVANEKQNPPHGDAEALVVDSTPMTASHPAATASSVLCASVLPSFSAGRIFFITIHETRHR